jgi:23S rRNA pseudouridine2457 synthase
MLVLFNKPFNVLCQFTDSTQRETLAKFIHIKNIYAAGRLDRDSEGLLLLTDHGKLQNWISDPSFNMPKTYWAQLEGQIDDLCHGIELNDGMTMPAKVTLIDEPAIWPRNPPIRVRKTIPTSWIELTITEGRNRQVRRMTAAVGFPTLRLIRVAIGPWSLDKLQPGDYVTIADEHLIITLGQLPDIGNPKALLQIKPQTRQNSKQRIKSTTQFRSRN